MIAETIKQICKDALKPLEHVSEHGTKSMNEFVIECGALEDFNDKDIRKDSKFELLFNNILNITGPAVYYFEIISEHQSKDIMDALGQYSQSPSAKTTPPVSQASATGKILYVGKVKRKMWGRLIQHLGYYKVNGTQGLQLYYWAKQIPLTLKLVVFEFEPEMSNLVSILEKELAQSLNPILGKHK